MPTIKNIFFDLDGTIIDPKNAFVNSMLYAINALNINEPQPENLYKLIGPPLSVSLQDRYNFSTDEADIFIKNFREYMTKNGLSELEIYPDIIHLLDKLKKKFRLFIATGKPTPLAIKSLKKFNLIDSFEDIIGSNLDNTMTKKEEVIDFLLKKHQLNAEETIMIGDRKYDILGSKFHDMKNIGVLYGYGSKTELENAGANFLAQNISELENIILENFSE